MTTILFAVFCIGLMLADLVTWRDVALCVLVVMPILSLLAPVL